MGVWAIVGLSRFCVRIWLVGGWWLFGFACLLGFMLVCCGTLGFVVLVCVLLSGLGLCGVVFDGFSGSGVGCYYGRFGFIYLVVEMLSSGLVGVGGMVDFGCLRLVGFGGMVDFGLIVGSLAGGDLDCAGVCYQVIASWFRF